MGLVQSRRLGERILVLEDGKVIGGIEVSEIRTGRVKLNCNFPPSFLLIRAETFGRDARPDELVDEGRKAVDAERLERMQSNA